MRFAYADPPYLGCAVKHYGDHPDAAVYDTLDGHKALIERLVDEFPDGWALSMTTDNLFDLRPLVPRDCRIAAWVKPFAAFKANVTRAYAWEPVIFRGGRNPGWGHPHQPPEKGGKQNTPKDFHVEHYADMLLSPITLKRGLTGAKPEAFCFWVFDLLNLRADDELVDLFPGSEAVTHAWERWRYQMFPSTEIGSQIALSEPAS